MFHGWENFFIMAGTAAATLIGLMFVVIALSVSLVTTPAASGVHAFVTPVLVHFGGVLLLSLVVLVPWPSAWPAGVLLGLIGIGGITYAIVVLRLLRQLEFVALKIRDWITYGGAPGLANVGLVAAAVGTITERTFAPYAVAGAIVLLLFVGLLDAWDVTLWIIKKREPAEP